MKNLVWIKKDGVIHFTSPFIPNGWTGKQWKKYFGDNRAEWADQFLDSTDFQPTPAGTIVNLAIILGESFTDNERITRNIRAKEEELKCVNPNADCTLLVVKNFSVKEIRKMGLSCIIGMHDPICDPVDGASFLGVDVVSDDAPWLRSFYDYSGHTWLRDHGFVVAVP